jgi:hypothetical protein
MGTGSDGAFSAIVGSVGDSGAGAGASPVGGADEVGGAPPLPFPFGGFGDSAADVKLPPPALPGNGVTLMLSRAPDTACQPSALAPPPVK